MKASDKMPNWILQHTLHWLLLVAGVLWWLRFFHWGPVKLGNEISSYEHVRVPLDTGDRDTCHWAT
jgi:hypothetical protein